MVKKDSLTKGLSKFVAGLKDLNQPLEEIRDELIAEAEVRFDTKEGPDGKKWKPSYKFDFKLNRFVKNLRETLIGDRRKDSPGNFGQRNEESEPRLRDSIEGFVQGNKVVHGSDSRYAKKVQDGIADRPGAEGIPRKFIGFSQDSKDFIQDVISDHVKRLIR